MEKEKIKRIIDANVNRAVEGLRILEEIARFILEDKETTNELKNLRFKVRFFVIQMSQGEGPFIGREIKNDVGKELYSRSEAKRKTVMAIFLANAKRAQEALRVLEEFSKLTEPRWGKVLKSLRFKVYELEKKLYYALMRKSKLDFDLYLITDPMRDHLEVARTAISTGVKIIQLRDKQASKTQLLKWALKIGKLTRKSGITFIINDYPDIARKANADGLHVGQDDLKKSSIGQLRRELGEDKIIGISVENVGQAIKAQKRGADYIAVGPIFPTENKPESKALGLKVLEKIVKTATVPVVAIGGIGENNLEKVLKTGCRRVAVISAVLGKKDISEAINKLKRRFKRP